jgi:hypothetical protein
MTQQTIELAFVSFEQAKLLKEKRIEIPTEECFYVKDEINNIEEHQIKNRDVVYNGGINYIVLKNEYRVYYQSEFLEWLRINHGIWISVRRSYVIINNEAFDKYMSTIEFITEIKCDITDLQSFDTPKEAYSAAFDYVIRNLI